MRNERTLTCELKTNPHKKNQSTSLRLTAQLEKADTYFPQSTSHSHPHSHTHPHSDSYYSSLYYSHSHKSHHHPEVPIEENARSDGETRRGLGGS